MPSQKYMVPAWPPFLLDSAFPGIVYKPQSWKEDSMQQTCKFSLWLRPDPSSVAHTELVAAVKALSAKTSGELFANNLCG